MTQLRETIWALHHEAVTVGDFSDRLFAHVRERAALDADAPAVDCVLDTDGQRDRPLSPAQTLHLYRIAQEAVQNAFAHADAHRLSVRLDVDGDVLTLEVGDDGRFVPPSPTDGLHGYGLAGMRRRAEAVGATFSLDTTHGTTVRVRVSLTAAPPEPGMAPSPLPVRS